MGNLSPTTTSSLHSPPAAAYINNPTRVTGFPQLPTAVAPATIGEAAPVAGGSGRVGAPVGEAASAGHQSAAYINNPSRVTGFPPLPTAVAPATIVT